MSRLPLVFNLFIFSINPIRAATTVGPLADVSIKQDISYSTARSCAACCIWYNGVYPPNVVGYQDLAINLQCGAGAINGCYCSTGLVASASSYLSSCVSSRCGKSVTPVEAEVSSMLNLYNGYCATANKAVSTTATNVPTTTGTSTASPAAGVYTSVAEASRTSTARDTNTQGASTTSSAPPQSSSPSAEDSGLSKSDIIALATALGVGIPSLLVAAAALYFQLKKKRDRHSAPSIPSATELLNQPAPVAWNNYSQQSFPQPFQGQPHVYHHEESQELETYHHHAPQELGTYR